MTIDIYLAPSAGDFIYEETSMLIRDGLVVLEDGPVRLDVRTRGEIVVELGSQLSPGRLSPRASDGPGELACLGSLVTYARYLAPPASD